MSENKHMVPPKTTRFSILHMLSNLTVAYGWWHTSLYIHTYNIYIYIYIYIYQRVKV